MNNDRNAHAASWNSGGHGNVPPQHPTGSPQATSARSHVPGAHQHGTPPKGSISSFGGNAPPPTNAAQFRGQQPVLPPPPHAGIQREIAGVPVQAQRHVMNLPNAPPVRTTGLAPPPPPTAAAAPHLAGGGGRGGMHPAHQLAAAGHHQQQQQQQRQASPTRPQVTWSVPNPLQRGGMASSPPPPAQRHPAVRQQAPFAGASPPQAQRAAAVQQQQQQQQQHGAAANPPGNPGGGGAAAQQPVGKKKKVVLSAEAKQALAKAIWSAIKSPTGQIDPALLQAAVRTGLPQHAVVNAARVAKERDAQKRRQQQQQQQQHQQQQQPHFTMHQPPAAGALQMQQALEQQQRQRQLAEQQLRQQQQLAMQQAALQQKQLQQQQQQQQQRLQQQQQQQQRNLQQQRQAEVRQQAQHQRAVQAKITERSHWKRTQSGVFMEQKGRFLAVPFSVGAMVRTDDVGPALKTGDENMPARKRDEKLVSAAAQIQKQLLRRQRAALYAGVAPAPKAVPLLDPERCKRIKMEPKKYAKALDRVARKSRQALADSLLKQYKELNRAITSHQNEFFKFHRQRRADSLRLAKAVRDSLDKETKKVEKDAMQAERARLAALKANDMTAYTKLLEETKNERLKFLMDKTEKHFSEISALLQKRSADDGGDVATTGGSSYYATAHMKSEEVRQPSILVGGDLKQYQLAGLQWLVSLYNNKLNGILADEMGLGKTIQAISLLSYLMEFKHNLGPFLVIVPLSTLSNWESEFHKWCPAARTVVYKGTPNQRKEIYKDQVRSGHFNVLLTTYEYIIRDKKFLRKIVWQYAIVDEGHRMKNADSKFAVTLGTQYETKFRILLTGTPLMNDLSELWSLLNFLLPSIFNSVSTFDQWFSAPFAQFSGSSAGEDQEQDLLTNEERVLIIHRLHELLRPFMLRRVKSEVLDQLPEKVEKVLRCDLSSWQKELYKQISYKAVSDPSLIGTMADPTAPSRGLNNVVMQLRKVCNHPYLFSPEGYHINEKIIRSAGKVALLDEMLPKLKAAGHRVLMFTQMTQVMMILEDYFAYRGYQSLRLDGSTPADEREKRMYKFNAPDSPYFIFLLSTRAGGLGLNLTAADTVIIFDSDWNPMMDLQAQDRAHRIGQRSDVSVFRLITNSPVEEKILSRATEKLNVSELVVESGKFTQDSVDADTSLERKRLMEVLLTDFDSNVQQSSKAISERSGSDQGEDDDDNGVDTSDKEDDLNEMLSNNEADFQLYAALDDQLEKEGRSHQNLFTSDADVPDWIRYPQSGNAEKIGSTATLTVDGSRKRKEVVYDDGLTEKQFMRMMDKQQIAQEKAKKKRKTMKGAARADESATGDVAPAEEAPADSLLTDWTFRKLISCSKSVTALKEPNTKRRIAEIFLEKPDPATFPDYYEIIEKPIAINDILRKCRAKLYNNIPEFKADWKLMFANARKFNGEDSWVVQDAVALEKELERVLKKNGFIDDQRPPTSKKKKLRIKLSLKDLKRKSDDS